MRDGRASRTSARPCKGIAYQSGWARCYRNDRGCTARWQTQNVVLHHQLPSPHVSAWAQCSVRHYACTPCPQPLGTLVPPMKSQSAVAFSLVEVNGSVELHVLHGLQPKHQPAQSHARRVTTLSSSPVPPSACLGFPSALSQALLVVADAEMDFLISRNKPVNFPRTGSPAFSSTGCANPNRLG